MKIAIVGTAPTSRLSAPYDDESWEIWTLGANLGAVPRVDKLFQIHSKLAIDVVVDKSKDAYFEELRKLGDKLIVGEAIPELPEAIVYPKDEIVTAFGRYFTSSIALMLALAIRMGAKEIGLWGVDMTADEEYSHQRPCCEYYLGVARGMGINVTVARQSPILRATRIYGLEDGGLSTEFYERKQEILTSIAECDKHLEKRKHLQGQLDLVNDMARRWG